MAALALVAWWALWIGEHSLWGHYALHSGHAVKMGIAPVTLALAFITGWTIMTIAMMLPTTAPLVLMFSRLVSGRPKAAGLVAVLIGGYLAVWIGFGVVVFAAIRVIQALTIGNAWIAAHSWIGSAAILAGAGVYQFTPLKYTCLEKCRTPMSFLMGGWRGGKPGLDALRLGASHGLFCLGCCWSLMLVMFAMGTNGLAWMLVLGVVMAAEKNLPWGRKLSVPIGIALLGGAVWVIFGGGV